MQLDKQESEDCNSPVWQQLLPTSVPTSVIERSEVRVNIPTDEPTAPHGDKPKKMGSSSWFPSFAPSWAERQRLRNGGEIFRQHINSASSSAGSTEGDPRINAPKSSTEKSSSSPLMRLVLSIYRHVVLIRLRKSRVPWQSLSL